MNNKLALVEEPKCTNVRDAVDTALLLDDLKRRYKGAGGPLNVTFRELIVTSSPPFITPGAVLGDQIALVVQLPTAVDDTVTPPYNLLAKPIKTKE